ncbi:MAG: DNA replication/repair protein RecF [Synergistaceae bacterium]|jgi:DNA replication and repair protein RecF|uniref:DNA replication/repair protein RecF n=1 Tax=Sulfuricurvum sp. TaxID=2025608 RepID=UPI003D15127D
MLIKSIILSNFRNIVRLDWSPDRRLNILIGKNAQGKTSILESIYLACYLKSFRSAKNDNFILQGEKSALIDINLFSSGVNRNIRLLLDKERKEVRLNGKKPDSYQDFFSGIAPVLFAPEEIQLIRGTPTGRRTLIDRAVFQGNNRFIQASIDYNRYLRQRNKLLKDERPAEEIIPWTQGLIETGVRIRIERILYLERLSPIFREVYGNITDNLETAETSYPITESDECLLKELLSEEFFRTQDREKQWKQTLAGPHRDDPIFTIDGKPLRQYASQGQQRSFILAFKIAQIIELEKRTGVTPVLLLDDLTSELDQQRQKFFFNFIQQRSGQVFITTTDIDPLIRRGLTDGSFYAIEDGAIHPVAH